MTPTTWVEVTYIGFALYGISKHHSNKLPITIKIVFDNQDLQSDFENLVKQELLEVLASITFCDEMDDLVKNWILILSLGEGLFVPSPFV